jgi:hypothetical protein
MFRNLHRAAGNPLRGLASDSTHDQSITPDLEHSMAEQAGSHTVEVSSSHAAMGSHPPVVAHLIEQADRGTR